MLATLRRASHSFLIKLLLLLLVASFALWGVSDITSIKSADPIAIVGKEEITQQDYMREMERLRSNLGEYFTPEIVKKLQLFDLSLNDLISDRLVSQESAFMHVVIGEDLLREALAADPQFKNDKGRFDRTIFTQRLRQLRMSEKQYLDYLSGTVKKSLIEQTMMPPTLFDETLPKTLLKIQEEERGALIYLIDQPGNKTLPIPTDEELRTYYNANKSAYVAPEYRVLNYIVLDKKAVKDAIIVTEEELRNAYLSRQSELVTPEKRNVMQLLYQQKATAEQAYAMLRTGKTFDEVATSVPSINKDAKELGYVTKNQLPAAGDAVFALGKSSYTTPVKTDFGWHIFYVKDIHVAKIPAFDEMKQSLREELLEQHSNQALKQMVEKFEDATASGAALPEIAKTMGLSVQSIDAIDAHGQRNDNTLALDLKQYGALIEAGFALNQNKISEIGRLADGGYFIVQPSQIMQSRERALEEVRGIVVNDWTNEASRKAIRAYGDVVNVTLAGVKNEEDARKILAQQGITQVAMIKAKRAGVTSTQAGSFQMDKIKPAFTRRLFEQEKLYHPLPLINYSDNSFLGALYLGVVQKPSGQKDERYRDITQRLNRLYEQEISQQYLASLQSRFRVIRNKQVLQKTIENF